MAEINIGFIGGGNMAGSLITGLTTDGFVSEHIWVSDLDADRLATLQQKQAVHTSHSNIEIAEHSDVLVLSVKPQVLHRVASEISTVVQERQPLIISIAAGIREVDLYRWLGEGTAIVRCMPNTPALVQTGASALYANTQVSEPQRNQAESILRAVGLTVWVEQESELDAVTAVSGSGPAYFFLLMEAMEQAATEMGMQPLQARLLIEQTALGAAKLALESDLSPAQLRQQVTSPGGTTQAAIEMFEHNNFRQHVATALQAAQSRSIQLSSELGDK